MEGGLKQLNGMRELDVPPRLCRVYQPSMYHRIRTMGIVICRVCCLPMRSLCCSAPPCDSLLCLDFSIVLDVEVLIGFERVHLVCRELGAIDLVLEACHIGLK